MEATEPDRPAPEQGRVPPPPRQGGRRTALLAVPLVLVAGAALVVAPALFEMNDPVVLGVRILGALLIVPGLLGAAFVVPAIRYGRRHQPGRELGWTPLTPGEPARLAFEARPARYHGLWLCADVRHPFGGGARAVVSAITVERAGEPPWQGRIATCWGFAGDATGATHMFVDDRRPRYGAVPPSLVEFDRLLEARPTGRFRALSQLLRLEGLEPGEPVTVHVTVAPPPDATEARLHAYVAVPR